MTKNHIPKKKFGQNFLTAPYYTEKIASAVPAQNGENVVEIGPGKGALSKYLLKKYPHLLMVEMDSDVIPVLKENLGAGSYTIVNGDATKFDYTQLGDSYHAVGNLPYNVASHIIKKLLFTVPTLKSCTFMVQKEVAERICAAPGGKTIGFLTILVNYFGTTEKLFDVPPGAFFPKPKVVSSVFSISLDETKYSRIDKSDWVEFFNFVSIGYSTRRKKLSNTISKFFSSKESCEAALASVGLSTSVRPELLGDDDWVNVFKLSKAERGQQ